MKAEKVFFLHNPEDGLYEWASESELRHSSTKLQTVFGVKYIEDVERMLHYNQSFRQACAEDFHVREDELRLDLVVQWVDDQQFAAFHDDLAYIAIHKPDGRPLLEPYPQNVQTKDGRCYRWLEDELYYDEIN